ncbi:MAG: sporulation protein YqfC [Clostridia bacterium]|nr:sporulation protein YqfC [Clostridia bacterium]
MREKRTKKIPNKINRILEIPQEVSSNVPKITVLGFEQMMIENYKAILEYQDFYIRLSTEIGILNINGFNLNLKEMTTDDLQISGKIDSIDFEAIEDDENDT